MTVRFASAGLISTIGSSDVNGGEMQYTHSDYGSLRGAAPTLPSVPKEATSVVRVS